MIRNIEILGNQFLKMARNRPLVALSAFTSSFVQFVGGASTLSNGATNR